MAAFFVIPLFAMAWLSLQSGNVIDGFTQTFEFKNYATALNLYHGQIIRAFFYALIATVACILLGYPIAYWIAFRAGKYKSTFLLIVLLPFFITFILRIVAWQQLLSDNGPLLGTLKNLGLASPDVALLGTPTAVMMGLAYNQMPFMILPIYVALERIDPSYIEAANDLFSSPLDVFRRIILPLSQPGLFAGVLLTFTRTAGDFVTTELLGSQSTTMTGNIIKVEYLVNSAYPIAATVSTMLTLMIIVIVGVYGRLFGTKDVTRALAA
jgi:spermidine/putrescine transport system permease protein